MGGNSIILQKISPIQDLPSFPTGVTGYIPTSIYVETGSNTAASILFAQMINLGSIDISGASGTFTDGSTMPTKTELGVSRKVPGCVFREVTTALNAAPGSLTITYKDQDENTAETTTAQTLGNSSVVGNSGFIALNSPDTGVTDITAATRSAGTTPTGVIKFWGIIPIGLVSHMGGAVAFGEYKNLITSSFIFNRLPASTQLGAFFLNSAAKNAKGRVYFVGDS